MKNFLFYTFILVCAVACNSNVKKYYYDTGELKVVETINFKDSLNYLQFYYKNGQLESEGYISQDGKFQEFWKYYYGDGTIKWEGYYINGERIYDIDTNNIVVAIKTPSQYIEINKPFKFRVVVKGVYPDDYIVTKGYCGKEITIDDFYDDFPYTVTVTEEELQEVDKNTNSKYTELPIVIYFLPTDRYKNKSNKFYFENLPSRYVLLPIKRE